MNDTSRGEILDEASNWIVGGGIVTMALFPLALPGIVLAVAAAIPLVALALPVLLICSVGVAALRLVRSVGRLVAGSRRRHEPAGSEVIRVRPAA